MGWGVQMAMGETNRVLRWTLWLADSRRARQGGRGAKKRRRPANRSRVGDQDDNTKEKIDDGSGDDLRQTHVVANSTRSQISRTAGSDGVTKGGYNNNEKEEKRKKKGRSTNDQSKHGR